MQLVAASAAASTAGCQPDPPEQVMPYVRRPLDTVPGRSSHYATSWVHDGYATGLIVTTREGRPIKVEGNPAHPSSLGATSHFHQAAVLQLYDPDRASTALHRGLPATVSDVIAQLGTTRSDAGAGLALLLDPTSSPLIHAQIRTVKQRYPRCQVTWYAPTQELYAAEVSRTLFGRDLSPQLDLAAADTLAVYMGVSSSLHGTAVSGRSCTLISKASRRDPTTASFGSRCCATWSYHRCTGSPPYAGTPPRAGS